MSVQRTTSSLMTQVENSASATGVFQVRPGNNTPVINLNDFGTIKYRPLISTRNIKETKLHQIFGDVYLSKSFGNYSKDHEVVHTSGRAENNVSLVKDENSFIEKYYLSEYQTGTIDFLSPHDYKNEHVIVSRFHALSAPNTHGLYSNDRVTNEFSPYNSLNNRNSLVREVLNQLSAEHSNVAGLRSVTGSDGSALPSFHGIYRNPRRLSGSGIAQPVHDNYFVQSHIPQNDFSYSWINKSAQDGVYDFLSKNENIGHQHTFEIHGALKSSETINFMSQSEVNSNLDFLHLNIFNSKSLDLDTGTTTSLSTSLNSILLNNGSFYGWPTWRQIRGAESPIVRAYKKNNIYSLVFRGDSPNSLCYPGSKFDYKNTVEDNAVKQSPRIIQQYKDTPITNRYFPIVFTIQPTSDSQILNIMMSQGINVDSQQYYKMIWNIDWAGSAEALNFEVPATQTTVRSTIQNNLCSYSNQKFLEEKGYYEKDMLQSQDLQDLNVFIRDTVNSDSNIFNSYQMNYIEKIYPLELNTYTSNSRSRNNFNFFGWKAARNSRNLQMSGNIKYGNFLFPEINMAPKITTVKEEQEFERSYFNRYDAVDLNNFNNDASFEKLAHLTQSSWVLDSRINFQSTPIDIVQSYFNDAANFMQSRSQGTRGEGILQNDFNLFPLGINVLHGAPPVAPLYARRVVQNYSSSAYLAGEAKWEAAVSHSIGPFYDEYDSYASELKTVGQSYSLVPEFRISKFVDNIFSTMDADRLTENMNDFLEITGAVYHSSSNDVQVGTQFFKTYSNTEFLKYFQPIQKNNFLNNFDLVPTSLTLKCCAAKRFLPYRGFYPAERIVQISEIFEKSYLPSGSYSADLISSQSFVSSSDQVGEFIRTRIQNSKMQALKPIMAPGVLLNSIKSGIAVDYPIFSSNLTSSLAKIKQNTSGSALSMLSSHSVFSTGSLCFTGSLLNASTDSGIPRVTGSVSRRITFNDLIEPERLYEEILHDNEPHPSASLLYGSDLHFSILERPAKFGTLDNAQTKTNTGIDFRNTQVDFSDKIMPFKSAVQNFTSEAVNFFLEEGKLTTVLSEAVSPRLIANKQYRMYVYLENTGISMYDRHSAYGPAVDSGQVQLQRFEFVTAGTGANASGSLKLTGSYSNAASLHEVDFTLKAANSQERTYRFSTGSSPATGQLSSGRYIIKITDMNTANILSEINTAVTAIHSGSITVTANNSDSSVAFVQSQTGSDGNHTISKAGSSSSNISVAGFAGGATGSMETSRFLTSTNVLQSASHGYLPYVPPFLDPKTSPYAEITFSPDNTDNYSIKEIIEGSTITYYNIEAPNNPTTNSNYINSMNLGASLNLNKFVRLKKDNFSFEAVDDPSGATLAETPIGNTDKYRWVIQAKWETPVFNFQNVTSSVLNLENDQVAQVTNSPWKTRFQSDYYKEASPSSVEYLTSSKGIWHQKGDTIDHNSNKGYVLGISGPYVENEEATLQNLAVALGLAPRTSQESPNAQNIKYNKNKIGKVSKNKKICEAIVAIPYYTDNRNRMVLFEVSNSVLRKAKSFNRRRRDQFRINYRSRVNDYESANSALEKYESFYGDTGRTTISNLAYQLRMLDKYVLPPHFDFKRNQNVDPHVQFIFQFQANLTEQDLSDMWQNLYPGSGKGVSVAQHSRVFLNEEDKNENRKAEDLDTEYVTCNINVEDALNNQSTFTSPEVFLKEKVRWLVFKSKFRGITNYNRIINKSISLFEDDIIKEENDLLAESLDSGFFFNNYGYNWPYDYFSIVELAEISAKVDFNPSGPTPAEEDETGESIESLILDFSGTTTQVPEAVSQDPKQTDFIARNFITTVNSGSIDQVTLSRTIKEAGDSVPSPANRITIDLPDGFTIKSGTESIFVNGVLQIVGTGNDYTLSGNTISFTYDLANIDAVKASYIMDN